MKIKELIARLAYLDQELDVYIDGYEDGLEDVGDVMEVSVMRNLNDTEKFWWVGPHEIDSKGETRGVYLPRGKTFGTKE